MIQTYTGETFTKNLFNIKRLIDAQKHIEK